MKNNIIELPAGRIRRDTRILRAKQSRDPDLFVNLVEADPGHIARREARREAYYQAAVQEREEQDRLMRDAATVGMFSMLGAVLAVGLAL